MNENGAYNSFTGLWEEAIPLPFSYGLIPWIWLRMVGYRDEYGRKAQLLLPWQ
jgi:hypothetical protein